MKAKGFTLVELLVVIAIIGLLSAVATVALEGSRSKGRDAKRVADVKQLMSALDLYFTNHNAYPSTGGTYQTIVPGTGALHALETDGILGKLPADPNSTGGGATTFNEYYYGSPGWWDTSWPYQIQFQLENQNDTAGNRYPTMQMWGTRYMYSVHP